MNDFKTKFNPLVAIFRLVLSLFFGGLCFLFIHLLLRDLGAVDLRLFLISIVLSSIFGVLFLMFFKPFIATTKNYLIKDNSIHEFNILTLSTRIIYKDEVKCFSTSVIPYRIWDFKQIIIYLKDGTKIDIMQFSYFNFKKIDSALINKGYNYRGFEPYIWKWFDSRVYSYDD